MTIARALVSGIIDPIGSIARRTAPFSPHQGRSAAVTCAAISLESRSVPDASTQ